MNPVIKYAMKRSDGLEYDWDCFSNEQWKKFHEGFQKLVDETGIIVICSGKKNEEPGTCSDCRRGIHNLCEGTCTCSCRGN